MSVHDVQCRHESSAAPGGRREVGQGDGVAEPRQEAGYRCHKVCLLYLTFNRIISDETIISSLQEVHSRLDKMFFDVLVRGADEWTQSLSLCLSPFGY